MAYSTISKPSLHFNTKLYTGNGSTQSITGVGFQPDFTWLKSRSNANVHALFDAVRGVTKRMSSNDSSAEYTEAGALTAFDSDGFSLGNWTSTNGNGHTLASWNWKAGGAGSANTDGTINSTVSVNTIAGFSIVKYEATANATIGHGLGVKPAMVITKSRDDSTNWASWHQNLTGGNENDRYVNLNTTAADDNYTNYWGTGGFTSSVFGVSNTGFHNNSNSMIAYCFAEKKGYSKFGSYTGNGNADGTFIYTGFKPAWVMYKVSSTTSDWYIQDNKRLTYNVNNTRLEANNSDAEVTGAADSIDMLSNGFKMRNASASFNASGATYIYMAFGQSLVGSNNVPCTAR